MSDAAFPLDDAAEVLFVGTCLGVGAILRDPDNETRLRAAVTAREAVEAEGPELGDFADERNRLIYAAWLTSGYGDQDDVVAALERERTLEVAGGAAYVDWLADRARQPLELARLALRVRASANRGGGRALVALAREIAGAPPTTLQVMTARELCERPDPPTSDQLLGPLVVRRQRTILGAHTGEGKTTMLLQVVAAVLDGRGFLGWDGAGEARALVIDAEQGERTAKRRLREAGLGGADRLDYARVPDGLALDSSDADVAEIEALLAAGEYDVVVAGPLYKMHRGDSNDERAAVDLMRTLDRWRDEYGFALLSEVHLRKPPPQGARLTIHDVFGSSAYVRGAEVVLGLRRVAPGIAQLHFFKDRDGDLPVGERWALTFDREHGFRRDERAPKPSTAERVRELREAQPDITQTRAAEILRVSDRTVREYWHDDALEQPTLLEAGEEDGAAV